MSYNSSPHKFQSLPLTALADLHEKICELTSTVVRKDGDSPSRIQKSSTSLQQNYETLNRRIAALQRQIVDKHLEAEGKVKNIREILRREQAELIKISEAMNRERKRNLALHLTLDESTCWMNNCTAECSATQNIEGLDFHRPRE